MEQLAPASQHYSKALFTMNVSFSLVVIMFSVAALQASGQPSPTTNFNAPFHASPIPNSGIVPVSCYGTGGKFKHPRLVLDMFGRFCDMFGDGAITEPGWEMRHCFSDRETENDGRPQYVMVSMKNPNRQQVVYSRDECIQNMWNIHATCERGGRTDGEHRRLRFHFR
jgi:uncharacterized Zn-finger protein